MNKRRYFLAPINEAAGDLWPFKRCVINGKRGRVDAPAGNCFVINSVKIAFYFCADWLPGSLLPPKDTDDWCKSVMRFFARSASYGARERRIAGRAA